VENNRLVYLGNHLFNHFNAVVISETELKQAYQRNQEEINQYSNGTWLFSYPFGQPGSCYNDDTDRLIESLGAEKIFSAFPMINPSASPYILHRISNIPPTSAPQDLKFPALFGAMRTRIAGFDPR